jgi:UrcA family protein
MSPRSGARRIMNPTRRLAMLKPILFAAAALASAVTASPVFAKPISPEVRVVTYADLDLSSAAGRDRLEHRIQAAVREVCGAASASNLARREAVRQCLTETRANVRLPASPASAGTR